VIPTSIWDWLKGDRRFEYPGGPPLVIHSIFIMEKLQFKEFLNNIF